MASQAAARVIAPDSELRCQERRVSTVALRTLAGVEGVGAEATPLTATLTLQQKGETFFESVQALARIHHEHLWQPYFASFNNYARERWQVTRQRLYQVIRCMDVLLVRPRLGTENAPTGPRCVPGPRIEHWKVCNVRAAGDIDCGGTAAVGRSPFGLRLSRAARRCAPSWRT